MKGILMNEGFGLIEADGYAIEGNDVFVEGWDYHPSEGYGIA